MLQRRFLTPAILVLAAGAISLAQDRSTPAATDGDGFIPLFNGKNLDGWVNVNCHPGTFFVKDGEIITTGKPTGFLRTSKQYENFILEMDWMHENKKDVGNSGLFVWGDPIPAVGTGYTRGIEVQVLVNLEYKDKMGRVTATSHGDLFSIWGAKCVPDRPHPAGSQRCLPNEYRAKGGGEWNHYKVIANDGVIKLEVNGKEVSGVSKCNPRKGYLALESEDAVCHFKNIRIKELPSTNPKPEEIAKVDEGHVSLFNGLDLAGWKTKDGNWTAGGGVMRSTGTEPIRTEKKYDRFELILDWKLPTKSMEGVSVVVGSGSPVPHTHTHKVERDNGRWNRMTITVDGDRFSVAHNGTPQSLPKNTAARPGAGAIEIQPAKGLEVRNVFLRVLK